MSSVLASLSKVVATCAAGVVAASYRSTAVSCQQEREFELVQLPPPVLLTNPSLDGGSASTDDSSASPSSFEPKTWGIKWDTEWDRHHPSSSIANPSPVSPRSADKAAADVVPPTTSNANNKPLRQFIMVRHGQYCNESNNDATDAEKVLTDLGKRQAHATGLFLRSAFENRVGDQIFISSAIDRVFVSELTRARQTASILLEAYCNGSKQHADALLQPPDALLNERFPCDPEPPYPKKAKLSHMKIVEDAFAKYVYRPGGRTVVLSSQQEGPSSSSAGDDIRQVDLMVGHGNIIRYFVCRALQLPPEAWLRLSIPHCSVTSIVIRHNGTVKLSAFGSFSHLAPELQTVMNVAN